ncbi:magnesium/cobalt transporter CorA [Maridesulfovibrio sp.]|uniref:magnesium/cobalt transporter CorA n=1 Tax=Maridesulfovibrio sp. TaxID=2795000 RepID=UPI0039EEE553
MARFLNNKDQKAGMPPGSLVFTGQHKISEPQIRVTEYNSSDLEETALESVTDIPECPAQTKRMWLNLDGIHDAEVIKKIGDSFNLSPLVMEDILDTGQRPFVEDYQDQIFTTLKLLIAGSPEQKVFTEQISFVLGENFLISFQEQPNPTFDPVRKRLMKHKSKIRNYGPDYLFYTLVDSVLENYLKVVEVMGERIEDLEEEVTDEPSKEHLESINFYRREIAYIRKAIRPVREIILKLNKLDSEFIAEETLVYMKDLPNMIDQALDSLEIYKDILGDLFTTYNMYMATRLNETMKFLTVFSTIFIPLTFLAGIYGMNFDFIPELHYKSGYYVLLCLMIAIAIAMLVFFRKRKWI